MTRKSAGRFQNVKNLPDKFIVWYFAKTFNLFIYHQKRAKAVGNSRILEVQKLLKELKKFKYWFRKVEQEKRQNFLWEASGTWPLNENFPRFLFEFWLPSFHLLKIGKLMLTTFERCQYGMQTTKIRPCESPKRSLKNITLGSFNLESRTHLFWQFVSETQFHFRKKLTFWSGLFLFIFFLLFIISFWCFSLETEKQDLECAPAPPIYRPKFRPERTKNMSKTPIREPPAEISDDSMTFVLGVFLQQFASQTFPVASALGFRTLFHKGFPGALIFLWISVGGDCTWDVQAS